ncbi:MAG: 4'-phosphopantetheinyl transferase superfamily protein [Verrucomicrobiota bacterium]|jgi:4'-phosphopantetheinyl transferase|nr:4'-phosphopantetheinyl transferase superfamily protein [Verrucomicrobiota bacterium]
MGLLELKSDEIHVWRIPLGQSDTAFPNVDELSQSEQIKANKFQRRSDRLAYCHAHLAKRNILSSYIGQTPQSIVFQSNFFGKPSISKPCNTDLHFNLTHTSGLALLATSRSPTGIDVERHRVIKNWQLMASEFFHRNDVERLVKLPNITALKEFFRLWTRTESVVKAKGTGLQKKQNSILWNDRIVIDLDIDPNFSAALSWEDQVAKQINLLSYSDLKLDSEFKANQYLMGHTAKM